MAASYYEILGVSRNAEPTVIDAAYRALMKRYHPDSSSERDSGRSAKINEAYSVLRDAGKRAAYDAQLSKEAAPFGQARRPPVPKHDNSAGDDQGASQSAKKRCPQCAELIQAQARVCRFCGADLGYDRRPDATAEVRTQRRAVRLWDWALLAFLGLVIFAFIPSNEVSTADNPPARVSAPRTTHPASVDDSTVFQPPKAKEMSGRCLLSVQGRRYVDGPCLISLDPDGSFTITSADEQYFAMLFRQGSSAQGYWNGGPGSTHAQDPLGQMRRNGACWLSDQGKLCAWANE